MTEMKYISEELWEFIEKFKEMGDYDHYTDAQVELAQRLENMPIGMLLNQPLQEEKSKLKV